MSSFDTRYQLIADETDSASWRDAMVALRLYCEKRGSADVAPRVRARGIALGKWVARCRDDYWHGALSAEHTNELESVDGWSWGPRRPGTWRHAFDLLAEYATQRGTAVLTDETRFDDVDLQTWTSAQRLAYAELRLPGTSIQLLEELPGWDWDADAARWVQGLAAAHLYIESHGSLEAVIRETQVGAFRLGHWIQRCREDYRAATMPAARSAALEALSGWSWRQPSLESWSAGLEALQRYISREGHAAPPQGEVLDEFALGWWVTRRRRDHRAGTLSPERAAELEALPEWQWDPNDHRWQRGLAALAGYAEVHGHASPTRGERFDEYPVGDWVRAQRTARLNGRLSSIRAARLGSLRGWRWNDD